MILGAEIIFVTVGVIVILGGVVYLLYRPRKGNSPRKKDGDLPI